MGDVNSTARTQTNSGTQKYNTFAILSFVLSFGSFPAGFVLAFIALSQIKKTGERGKGLALAAMIIGILVLIGLAFIIIGWFVIGGIMARSLINFSAGFQG